MISSRTIFVTAAVVLLFLAGFAPSAPAAVVTLGNEAVSRSQADGWDSILLVNESDTYTNTSAAAETVTIGDWSFYGLARSRITPFVVRVNGDDDFTVLAIGRTRVGGTDYPSAGTWTFPFGGSRNVLALPAGQTLAIGFTDANADGTGSDASVVHWDGGTDELWLTGGGGSTDAGSVTVGQAPAAGTSTYTNLKRDYSFNIAFDVVPEPAALVLLALGACLAGSRRRSPGRA